MSNFQNLYYCKNLLKAIGLLWSFFNILCSFVLRHRPGVILIKTVIHRKSACSIVLVRTANWIPSLSKRFSNSDYEIQEKNLQPGLEFFNFSTSIKSHLTLSDAEVGDGGGAFRPLSRLSDQISFFRK